MEGLDQIERIVVEMHRQRLTISKLAIATDISRNTISNLINRKVNCTHEIVEKICNELNLELKKRS